MIWSVTGDIPPEGAQIEQLAKVLNLSSDILYFYTKRVPPDVRRDATDSEVEAAYKAFRRVIDQAVDSELCDQSQQRFRVRLPR